MTNTRSKSPIETDDEAEIDYEKAQRGVRLLLEALGEDPTRDGLSETWQRRVPEAFRTLTAGQRETTKPTMRTFEAETDDLIVKTGIPVYSLCEHHLLPFYGTVHLGYRPDSQVVGLSKLTRYVRWQARQLTMQERLTNDLARGLAEELDAPAVLVEITANHLCEAMRGIETESTTTTRASAGDPTDTDRNQFERAIRQMEDT